MCRRIFGAWLIMAFLLCDTTFAAQYAFRITFTDKNNTPYSLSTPAAYLSSRALARRSVQGISVDSTDLPVNASYIDSVLALTGGKLHTISRWLNNCTILLETTDSVNILALAGRPYISNVLLVGYYSPDLHKPAISTGTGNPLPARKTSGLDATYYGATWDQTQLVEGNYLHDNAFKGQGKLIAVLDAGFLGLRSNPGFDSLHNAGRLVDSFDFVWHSGNINQQDTHGAEVLSTMAGYWPGTFVGSAPLASYALYLTEYNGNDQPLELDNMICAVERADSIGADIVTESLGYDLFDFPPGSGQNFSDLDGKTTVAAKAANFATKKGMLFVATAGNDGGGAGIPGWGTHILTPGDADSALTIGSTDATGTVWATSGYGPNAAGQVKPDVVAMGHAAAILDPTGVSAQDGTSFSTPQIAGWAACLWQANPAATPWLLRQAIIRCANAYTDPGSQNGYGVPNFHCTAKAITLVNGPSTFSATQWLIASPNPSKGIYKIDAEPNTEDIFSFRVTDATGRIVQSFNKHLFEGFNNSFTVDISGMPCGVYILSATSSSQRQIIKIEKN